MLQAVLFHCCIQFLKVLFRCLGDLLKLELLFVGVRLQVGGVREQHPAFHKTMLHCLTHDLVEDLLKNSVFLKASGTIEADGGMMGNPVGNLEPQKPSIGKIESYFLFQLPFGADPIEITDEKHLDEEYRVYGRSPTSLAV